MSAAPCLMLVDGMSYLFRAFHALPPLKTSDQRPTGAIRGVASMLRKLRAAHECDFFAVVMDAKGRTSRDDLYPQYKATRAATPPELNAQIEPLIELVKALGLPLLSVPGVEADDVIGTLARRAAARGLRVLMSTGDKDMAQLVDERITLVNTMDNKSLDIDGVKQKFGVPPTQMIDWLTLVGDSVDNVPGVPSVGPKTATKWLTEWGSLDALVAHADEVKGKVGEKLRESLGQLPLSRELVTIRCDVELEVDIDDLVPATPDNARLRELYTDLEFTGWLSDLLGDEPARSPPVQTTDAATPPPATSIARDYEMVVTEEALERWLARLRAAELICFDTETTSLDYMQAEIVGVSFAVAPGEAAYVPLAHRYAGAPDQLDRERVLAALAPLLEDPERPKVGQHLKYDMNVLARHGIALAGVRYDTMLESYVLDSTATRHDMDSLALKYLGERTIKYEEVAGKGARQIGFEQVPVETATPYAAEDADVTLRLHRELWPRLQQIEPLRTLFETIEMPLVPVLSRMERTGVAVDRALLRQQSGELARRMAELETQAHAAAGHPFNIGSPKQIQAILFDELKLPVLSKTPKGQPSTAESVLEELALEHELPRLILDHRAVSKLKSTYTDTLPERVDPQSGRVHTSYHQAVASTGRLSSTDPNLQNIPIRSAEGRRIRQAFVAPPGHVLLAADYSQIELRIMAHLSGDEGLRNAFECRADVHRATAAEVFGTTLGEVSDDQRRSAKAINFGLIYGMSAFGLGRQLGIPRDQAQAYIERYFERYPGVRRFMDETRQQARERGYVETVFGRRLYLPEINVSNAQRRQYAERTAINAPMQGTAADIIKRAMLSLDAWLGEAGVPARMIMQVHDELVFEVRSEALQEVSTRVVEHMVGAASLDVPLEVSAGSGSNWDEAH